MTGHFGTRKPYKPQVYVVVWDADRIIKAGFTAGERWKVFRARGARLVYLYTKDTPGGLGVVGLECAFDRALRSVGTPAFHDKASAAGHLAMRGAGWTECYRLDRQMLEHVLEHVLPSIAASNAFSTSTDVTDGRTNEEGVSVLDQFSVEQRAGTSEASSRWELRMTNNRAGRYAPAALLVSS